ncbi:hypothetical protein EC988_007369, partial [Linderina pennispora]
KGGKIAPELSQLITYCKAQHFESLEENLAAYDQVSSIDEKTSGSLIRNQQAKFVEFNSVQMTRVYPHYRRIGSSNFNPISHWNAGCQMVAMNYQTHDRAMEIYEAMFRRTHNAGYVLKPQHLVAPSPAVSSSSSTYSRSSSDSSSDMSHPRPLASNPAAHPRRTTVHLTLFAAYNAARSTGHVGNAGAATDSGFRHSGGTYFDMPSTPRALSRPPSTIAMFRAEPSQLALDSFAFGSPSLAAAQAPGGSGFLTSSTMTPSVLSVRDYPAVAGHHMPRFRVEIELITDGGVGKGGGLTATHSSVDDLTALASALNSAPGSPTLNAQHLTSFPFGSAAGTCGASAVVPQPALHSLVSGRSRYCTRNGTVSCGVVRWRDEHVMHMVRDPDMAFVRFAAFEDDQEV